MNKIFKFFKEFIERESKIFLTSDLHLDHENIIKYCKRPFKNIQEMNYLLIRNWNETVGKKDTVYFLGDFCFCKKKDKQKIGQFMNLLNGKKIFIKGNHDRFIKGYHHFVLNYKNKQFYLVHNPLEIPSSWKDWAIFGHIHNHKDLFIDKKNKRINISTDITGFKPVNIEEIIKQINIR